MLPTFPLGSRSLETAPRRALFSRSSPRYGDLNGECACPASAKLKLQCIRVSSARSGFLACARASVQHAERDVEDPRLMTADEQLQGVAIAPLHALDERAFFDIGRRGYGEGIDHDLTGLDTWGRPL